VWFYISRTVSSILEQFQQIFGETIEEFAFDVWLSPDRLEFAGIDLSTILEFTCRPRQPVIIQHVD
jgi:hypothetical protein